MCQPHGSEAKYMVALEKKIWKKLNDEAQKINSSDHCQAFD